MIQEGKPKDSGADWVARVAVGFVGDAKERSCQSAT